MEDTINLIKTFKAKLVLNGTTMKDFCREHGFDYAMFNFAINGTRPVRDEYETAIRNFTLTEDGRATLKKIRG